MDSLHVTKQIFDLLVYPYQIQSSTISRELRKFFKRDYSNSIEFWDCPSQDKWTLHNIVDKETKNFDLMPIFPYKSSWEFDKKNKCNEILNNWKIMFQASNAKGRQFLDLLDDDLKPIEPLYSKGGPWLNSSVTLIHYVLEPQELSSIMLPQKEFKCPCGQYPIKTR